jgi:hypothetical protein
LFPGAPYYNQLISIAMPQVLVEPASRRRFFAALPESKPAGKMPAPQNPPLTGQQFFGKYSKSESSAFIIEGGHLRETDMLPC